MNQVGRHLGRTARHDRISPVRTPRSLAHRLVHGGVRDRDAATWVLAVVLTTAWLAGMAWTLHAEATRPRPASAALLLGGWSLTLLPVHCAGRFRRAARVPSAAGDGLAADAVSTGRTDDLGLLDNDEGADEDESPPTPPEPLVP